MNEKQEQSQVEIADYATQPKNASTGVGPFNPTLRYGERGASLDVSVNPISRMNHWRMMEQALTAHDNPIAEGLRSGTLKMEQAWQALGARGIPTDIDSNIFTPPATDSARMTPVRSTGESEVRMPLKAPNADFDGNGLMVGANYLTLLEKVGMDLTGNPFSGKALVKPTTPLVETEYFNRKLKYLGAVDEELETPEAERLRRKEERRLERIQRKMAGGMTLEEAERNDAYNTKAGKELRDEIPAALKAMDMYNDLELLTYDQAVEQILAERKPGWEARIKKLQAQQEDMLTGLARSEANDQAKRKQVLLAEGYSEADAEAMKVYTKVEWQRLQYELQRDLAYDRDLYNRQYASPLLKARAYEEHIESILETKPKGWEQRVISLRKEQAELLEPVAIPTPVMEPPAPPPVLDFSTGDLELPERFIIKDLTGFKFDPDTQFDGLRLPYDSCLFVLGVEPERAVVLATQEDEDVITLKLLSEQKSELPWHAVATLYVRLNGTKARLKWANTRRALDKRLGLVSCVLGFMAGEQVNELEIETVITAPEGRDIPPPKPGWCYNVVHLTQGKKGKRKDWQGGTHASPREHKRKGYWWPGRKGPIWIKAMIVNKGVLGRVDKEYHVTKIEGV